jgi:hypothetical protein
MRFWRQKISSTLLFAKQRPGKITQHGNAAIAPLQVFSFKIVVFANGFSGLKSASEKQCSSSLLNSIPTTLYFRKIKYLRLAIE